MLYSAVLSLLVFTHITQAAPAKQERATGATAVVANGTVTGFTSNGTDIFYGIPFALPPVGQLRLKPPQSYNKKYPGGSFAATSIPRRCPQLGIDPESQSTVEQGEDCLTINIQRPTGTASNAKLPVLFWIYGGGFEFGSTSDVDASQLIQTGVSGLAKGHPIVFVAVNYRLGAFGFLGGKEVQADGSTNLGLRDQRLGLEWVAENIAAFGGDPAKVTIFGESAGAISVFDHTVINGGDNTYKGKPLFRGAIMNSGSVLPAENVNTIKAQAVYNEVVVKGGCAKQADNLACLRTLSYDTFKAAADSIPSLYSYSSLDLNFLPRPDPTSKFFPVSPDISLANGAITKVPIIIGDVEDEGTFFSTFQTNLTSTADVVTYLQSYFPLTGASLVPGLVATYPDVQSDGSPFGTSNANDIYPEFKRLAAILGDTSFTLTRRVVLSKLASLVPAWSFLDSHLHGYPTLGTYHASDVAEVYSSNPSPVTGTTYQTYYTSFVYHLDPNKITHRAPLISWPQYKTEGANLLHLNAANNTLLLDTFRSASYAYWKGNFGKFKV